MDFIMSEEQSFGGISELKQSESEIRRTFNRYIKNLFNEKWKIDDEMTEWSKQLIDQIQEYVTQQRNLLEEDYTKKISRLHTLRDQFIEQALLYEVKKDAEQINQLLKQCNILKVELVTLVYVDRPIPSIKLITEEQLMQRNKHKTEDEQFRKKPVQGYDNDNINNTDATKRSTSRVRSTNIRQNNSQPLITEFSDERQSTIYRDDSIEECPICSMVFSSNMALYDQSAHINEHFPND